MSKLTDNLVADSSSDPPVQQGSEPSPAAPVGSAFPRRQDPNDRCFYQDINGEIPLPYQKTVRIIYYVYLVYAFAFVTSAIGFFVCVLRGVIFVLANTVFMAIFQAIVYLLAVWLWMFRSVYVAYRDNNSYKFLLFFSGTSSTCTVCLVQLMGVTSFNCGWVNTVIVYKIDALAGIVMIVPSVTFTVAFIGMVFSLIKVICFYRTAGFSFIKDLKEFPDNLIADLSRHRCG